MGRGRQKAKQQKIARKLKYLTTDTDYDELAKELSAQEQSAYSEDLPEQIEEDSQALESESSQLYNDENSDDLDDYAKWAAEAAAKAGSQEKSSADKPKHKPFNMPLPSSLKKPKK
ncbi:MAG: DUF3073 domain-containing protein [Bifidobacteriaceae bacterium]|nr:DUF3073 domain-containing protein [Bifidobacteriaceae bacterium]